MNCDSDIDIKRLDIAGALKVVKKIKRTGVGENTQAQKPSVVGMYQF